MVVVATFRVRSKRSPQLVELLRSLHQHIALEGEVSVTEMDDEASPQPTKEVIEDEQGLRGLGPEAGAGHGIEGESQDGEHHDDGLGLAADGVSELAGSTWQDAAEVEGSEHADRGAEGQVLRDEGGAVEPQPAAAGDTADLGAREGTGGDNGIVPNDEE